MTRPDRALSHALGQLVSEPVSALVSVLALAHALFFVGAAAWLSTQTANAEAALADGLVVTASLDPALDEAQVGAIVKQLAEARDVERVRVRTPREERERLSEVLGPGLLDGLDDLALPMGVTVDLVLAPGALDEGTLTRLDQTLGPLAQIDGVIALPWSPTHARTLFALGGLVRWLALALGLGALIVSATVVAQRVRRRLDRERAQRELELAFGATRAFVELPSYLAAGLLGLLGAALALALALMVQGPLLAVTTLVPGLAGAAPVFGGLYLVWCVGAGLGVGLLAAWISLGAARREAA